jgi:hypothetical protein
MSIFLEDSKFLDGIQPRQDKCHHAPGEFFIPVLWIDRKECGSRPYRPFRLRMRWDMPITTSSCIVETRNSQVPARTRL